MDSKCCKIYEEIYWTQFIFNIFIDQGLSLYSVESTRNYVGGHGGISECVRGSRKNVVN